MTELTGENYDQLLHTIYRAALVPELWTDFVNQLSGLMAGTMIVMHGHDIVANASLGALASPVDPDLLISYDNYYAARNVWAPGIAGMQVGKAGHPEDALSQDHLLKSEFYNDWLKPLGGYSTASGIVLHRDAERFLILSGNIRPRDVDAIRTPLRRVFDRLAPHITHSFELMRALPRHAAEAEYRFANDHSTDPVFFLTAVGGLARANPPAESLLRSGAMIGVNARDGLSLREPAANASLKAALHSIRCSDYSGLKGSFDIRGDNVSMRALVAPFAPSMGSHGIFRMVMDDMPVAILVLKVLPHAVRRGDIAARFRLTRAELSLADAVAGGISLKAYSQDHGLSVHTVRNQLRSIYSKTDTHRQSELVALMLG
jgi:DNA-binding CsgD family transcriptional regulator/PAS domain-containing protein